MDMEEDSPYSQNRTHRGTSFKLEPPTHRAYGKIGDRTGGKKAPQAIPHLGPMLEATLDNGMHERGARNRMGVSPTGSKPSAVNDDNSKKVRYNISKNKMAFIGGCLLLLFMHWFGVTITLKQH